MNQSFRHLLTREHLSQKYYFEIVGRVKTDTTEVEDARKPESVTITKPCQWAAADANLTLAACPNVVIQYPTPHSESVGSNCSFFICLSNCSKPYIVFVLFFFTSFGMTKLC